MSETKVHASAVTGFLDGKHYDAFRPSYVDEATSGLLTGLNIAGQKNAKILEIAAGTGKFTECLAHRPERYEVVAVEPVTGMREQLEIKNLQGVQVKGGLANSVPVEDGWADAVIAAQVCSTSYRIYKRENTDSYKAFHWFAKKDALTEFARVLKPNGYLGVIWNVEECKSLFSFTPPLPPPSILTHATDNKPAEWPASTPWEEALNKLVFELPDDGQARFRQLEWRTGFTSAEENAGADGKPLFTSPAKEAISAVWETRLTPEQLLARMSTLSQVVSLKGVQREEWVAKFWKIMEMAEKDGEGKVGVHGKTLYAWAQKL
ncbi:hypothetical protein TD95_003169 [Thielaviopsis punctulata]|uniref:Methyltransferase domain-containing protein n=1 Tax=Thielaviopsis punctulata TaxID=72032 RepID=A0A0F4Z9Q1_9PEZI|nr:hypothetical protein TD95_003169 [Thielaviopsis punctulata]